VANDLLDEEPTVVDPPDSRRGRGAAVKPLLLFGGVAFVLAGAGMFIVSGSYDTEQTAKVLGSPANAPVNEGADDATDISAHNSPSLVRNPREEGNLVVADRIDTPRFSCAVHVSVNGGSSWEQKTVPAPKGEKLCYAPDVAFGADGTLYLSFVTLRGRENAPNAAWLATSDDNGATFSEPVKVLRQKLPFQVRLAADPSEPRRLYVTWLQASEVGLYRFPAPGNPINAMRSDDGGETWETPTRVSGSDRTRVVAASPVVGPNGSLNVVYLDLGEDSLDYEGAHGGKGGAPYDGTWALVHAQSSDQGATWDEAVVEDRLVPSERFIVFTPPFPSVAVDQDSGKLYAAFHDQRLGDQDAWMWSLPEGAAGWRGPTRINDTPERDKTSQYLPKIAVAPDGRVDAVYYDRRADRGNVRNQVSLQSSSDEGDSFGKRVRLSDASFSSEIGYGNERDLPDLGSRLGLISTDSRAFAVWTDTRAGTVASNKQDIARGVVAFSDPPRLSKPVEYLLRFGGIALALLGLLMLALAVLRSRRAA